ncbi:MAG TPA: efflux RND transporter periplasmic adaptor subunit [Pirellulales bacterium]|nr:efflux RND transporter periplasmic adaptor subunit [Pirellulales bacterium]
MKKQWLLATIVAVVGVSAGAYFAVQNGQSSGEASAADNPHQATDSRNGGRSTGQVRVKVVKPHQGGIERTTTQPGSVHSFRSAKLYSKVSGYLKEQNVDIGDRVEKDDVLAVIDMPEIEKEVEREEAAVQQAEAHVVQMAAHVESAKADYNAAKALIGEREADVEDAESMLSYSKKVYDRIAQLVKERGVEPALADEKEEKWHASKAALSSARASVVSAEAQASAAKAKIDEAEADLVDAQAKVEVAKAALEKTKVMLNYTKITSPYTGVITARNYFEGDFINARDQGATVPMLVVDETDWMRVVLQVPDLEVPYTNPGDVASVEIDALPDKTFPGKVSRMADSEDPQTRTMRTEVDLENKEGILRDGMYGKVTLILKEASTNLTVPSSAVHVESSGEHAASDGNHRAQRYLWVVRAGKAQKQHVQVGTDNGIDAEILSGLKADDDVVVDNKTALADGISVAVASNGKK